MPSVFDGHLRVQVFLGSLAIPYQFSLDPMMFCGFKFPFVCLSPLAWPGQGVTLCSSGGQIGMLAGPIKTVDSESSLVLDSHLMYDDMLDGRFQEYEDIGWCPDLLSPRILCVEPGYASGVCNLYYGTPTS